MAVAKNVHQGSYGDCKISLQVPCEGVLSGAQTALGLPILLSVLSS